jgi:hypothetical protein
MSRTHRVPLLRIVVIVIIKVKIVFKRVNAKPKCPLVAHSANVPLGVRRRLAGGG